MFLRKIVLLSLLIFTFFSLPVMAQTADDYVNQGNTFYTRGKYEEAIKYYDMALKVDSNNIRAYLNKGNACYALGKYNEAISCYDTVLMIDPNNSYAKQYKQKVSQGLSSYSTNTGTAADQGTVNTLYGIFDAYNNCILSGNIEGSFQYMAQKSIDDYNKLSVAEKQAGKTFIVMTSPSKYTVTGANVNGDKATLYIEGSFPGFTGGVEKGKGEIEFIKEGGQWKISAVGSHIKN